MEIERDTCYNSVTKANAKTAEQEDRQMKHMKFRKTLAALCAAAVTLTCAAGMGMSAAGAAQYATVTDDMNFRAVPRGYVMGTVPKGVQVQVLSYVDGWNKIIYNGQTGYIYGGNLSTDAVTILPSSSSSSSSSSSVNKNGTEMKVSVSSGYLRLRKSKEYRSDNELARLYNGETVKVQDSSDGTFWYVYVPSKGLSGYVNKNYLKSSSSGSSSSSSSSTVSGKTMTVKVDDGYLALRTAKAFVYENEIGSLYTGDKVTVIEQQAGTYWYVYSPKHGKYGYVNKNYLVDSSAPSSYTSKTVKVSDGYLALRNAKAFEYENEIGRLYTGDTFYVTDTSGSTYWYGYSPKHGKYGYVNKNYLY